MSKLKATDDPGEDAPQDVRKPLPPPRDYIEEVFGANGHLSKGIPNYQQRPSQIALSRAIEAGLRTERHVVAEGPTGTGKSLAYSVPAAYYAANAGFRCCIVTSNKTLQQQIYGKDLCDLKAATGWNFTYAIRKGLNSYLCERDFVDERYKSLLKDTHLAQTAGKIRKVPTPEEDRTERMIYSTRDWAEATNDGDKEIIEGLAPDNKVWSYFSSNSDDCDGKQCVQANSCYARKARDIADESNIIITNYWLFFMHVRNQGKSRESHIFPKFDLVIFDEAHNASDIARGYWGLELSKWSIRKSIAALRNTPGPIVEDKHGNKVVADGEPVWDKCWTELDKAWDQIDGLPKKGTIRLKEKGELKTENLEAALYKAALFYKGAARRIQPEETDKSAEANKERAEMRRIERRAERCEDLQSRLERFRELPLLNADRWKRQVYYLEEERDKPTKLVSKSLFVGKHLHHALFKLYPMVVLTSATLATSGGASKFEHIKREIGLSGLNPIELTVDSPFRWRDQCLMVIPDEPMVPSLNEKKEEEWKAAMPVAVEKIVRMTKGRTMILFTALERKRSVGDHLERAKLPFKILSEKTAAPGELQSAFRDDISSVLLGSKRFSEGIDIQGESCSCVIIDRLPFRRPGDPLMDAIGELRAQEEGVDKSAGGKLAFMEHSVPEAIISFKQRMGRLIRTMDDCGIVVVLDDRISKRSYSWRFFASIPNVLRTTNLAEGEAFMQKLGLL